MTEQIIYLDVDDDILTVRERLRRVQAKHVLLVLPVGCKALTRPLDFRLLHRQAAALGLDIALVLDVPAWRDLAIEEGLTVFSRLSLGRRVGRPGSQWGTADLPGLEGMLARLKRQRPSWWHWVLGPIVVVLVLGVLAWSVVMVWPSATVTVVPAREAIGVSTWVTASPSTRGVDWDRLQMPARVVQVAVVDRGEVETTGVTNVAAGKASGTALFVNATRRQVEIPVDTIVSTSAGTPVRFRTVGRAGIEPRGRVRVQVEAVEGGPSGNVRANLINRVIGPLASSLKVTNEAMIGGGTTEQVRRVTHGDKQQVSDLLIAKLLARGHAELSEQLVGEFLPIETMWINQYSIRTNYDHHVNDESDTLALEMRAVVGGLVVSWETADEIARRALTRQVRGGFRLLPETVHTSRGEFVEVDPDTGDVRFVTDGVALMEAEIDVGALLAAIRGRPIAEALAYMRDTLPIETEPLLEVRPEWMERVPWMAFRVAVAWGDRPEEVASAGSGP